MRWVKRRQLQLAVQMTQCILNAVQSIGEPSSAEHRAGAYLSATGVQVAAAAHRYAAGRGAASC